MGIVEHVHSDIDIRALFFEITELSLAFETASLETADTGSLLEIAEDDLHPGIQAYGFEQEVLPGSSFGIVNQ